MSAAHQAKKAKLILEICPEQGLTHQHFRCALCNSAIGAKSELLTGLTNTLASFQKLACGHGHVKHWWSIKLAYECEVISFSCHCFHSKMS